MTLAYSYIRFSTAEQAKGDSLRRQTERTEKYVVEKSLILDQSLTMKDFGISAFKGTNADQGALSLFLQAVDDGRVPKGSYLLVESLDRLSRAQVDIALELFLRIIRQGITIVTLADGREYSSESVKGNFTELIVSIAVMARAHEESLMKSDRVSKAWAQKRKDAAASGKVMSKVVPFWLKAKADRTGFEVISEKVALIHRMFELSLDGIGVHSIAVMMNREGQLSPTGKLWRGANIAKFLRNRAVIGEATFSSFMNEDGVREATDPIPNYFPAIVKESDFYAVRDRYATTTIKTEHGRKSDNRNIFRNITFCPYCGSTVSVFAMKYKRKDGYQHYTTLYCSNKGNGNGCQAARWDYYEFQKVFLNYVRELDITQLVGFDNQKTGINRVKEEIGKERLNKEQLSKKLSNLIALVEDGADIAGVRTRMQELNTQVKETEEDIAVLERELARLESEKRAAKAQSNDLKKLVNILGDPDHSPRPAIPFTDEQVRQRSKLSMMISAMVERIEMYSVGFDAKAVARLLGLDESKWPTLGKDHRFMRVQFKSGISRCISWNGIAFDFEDGVFNSYVKN